MSRPISPLLNQREVAELLRISTKTVGRLIEAKRLKSYQIGRASRISLANVERYLASVATVPDDTSKVRIKLSAVPRPPPAA